MVLLLECHLEHVDILLVHEIFDGLEGTRLALALGFVQLLHLVEEGQVL